MINHSNVDAEKFDVNVINQSYSNNAKENNNKLWDEFYSCYSFKNDTLKLDSTAVIKLEFNGKDKLTVIASYNGKDIKSIELVAKQKKNYIAIKRKQILIPIPFIWYQHDIKKIIITNSNTSNLILIGYESKFLNVLIASGGYDSYYKNEYERINI